MIPCPLHSPQVYHLEPSIAIASQFVNEGNKHTVFQHILSWCEGQGQGQGEDRCYKVEGDDKDGDTHTHPLLDSPVFRAMTNTQQVFEVINTGLLAKYGAVEGAAKFDELIDHW